jgi:hypothetical protein
LPAARIRSIVLALTIGAAALPVSCAYAGVASPSATRSAAAIY